MLTAAPSREKEAVRTLGRSPLPEALSAPAGPAQAALRAALVFQTTLELERLFELFARELAAAVAYDGLAYVNEETDLVWRHGEEAKHRLSYRLILEERRLGEAIFWRGRPFGEDEILLVEYLLGAFVYPLRNALDYRRAQEDASRDPLTGVYNRLGVDGLLRREIGLARRHSTPLSLAFLDLDRFKFINDTYGHATGDAALCAFVDRIRASIRDTDILARYGGDEFMLILSNTPLEGARLVAERIRGAVETLVFRTPAGERLLLTTSIGLAALAPEDTPESFCERADRALAEAKRAGRNRVAG